MKQELGKFIRVKRIENNLSLRGVAKATGVSPAFLCEIEKGKKYFPTRGKIPNFLDNMARVLKLDKAEYATLKRLVDESLITRQKIRGDIATYLLATPKAYEALCLAIELNVKDDGWENFINKISK